MGQKRTIGLLGSLLTVSFFCFEQTSRAQDQPDGIVFSSRPDATVRKASGVPTRGRLLGVSRSGIRFQHVSGREFFWENDEVRVVRTRDGSFVYQPGRDTYQDALKLASEMSGVRINDGTAAGPRELVELPRPPAPEPPTVFETPEQFAQAQRETTGAQQAQTAGVAPPGQIQYGQTTTDYSMWLKIGAVVVAIGIVLFWWARF